jgi:hypothetical protein
LLNKSQLLKNVPNSISVDVKQTGDDLMGTIKVPVNLHLISDRLPIANYDNDRRAMNRQVSMPTVAAVPQLTSNVIKKAIRDDVLRSAD